MLQLRGSRAFVCRGCLARRAQGELLCQARPGLRLLGKPPPSVRRMSRGFATVQTGPPDAGSDGSPSLVRSGSVPRWTSYAKSHPNSAAREYLRQWDMDNPAVDIELINFEGSAAPYSVGNPQLSHSKRVDAGAEVAGGALDADGEIFPHSTGVQPGDLVEVSTESWRFKMLAVCVGRIRGIDYFYTNRGKWFWMDDSASTDFFVPGFASADEFAPVASAFPLLPESDSAEVDRVLREMRDKDAGPSREVAAGLVTKLNAFLRQAYAARQRHAKELLDMHSAVVAAGLPFVSAQDAAALVLPDTARLPDGSFDAATLYGVYSALSTNELLFRRFRTKGHLRDRFLFEVVPPEDAATIRGVEIMSRAFWTDPDRQTPDGLTERGLRKHRLGRFLLRARQQIDQGRTLRGDPTPAEMLRAGPPPPSATAWIEEEDRDIMHFMYLWAGRQGFSRGSRIHGLGANLLKALDRYGHAPSLDPSFGWLFLQETGWVLPWDLASRHAHLPPGLRPNRAGGHRGRPPPMPAAELDADCYPGVRKQWTETSVFCIDGAGAVEIDDGVSIERVVPPEDAGPDTPRSSQYWIHAHIADPTSAVGPHSPAGRYAELVAMTSYLPAHLEPMFPDKGVSERFSLAPGRRCLTFSAKIDEADPATILDYAVTPGVLGPRVVYITPDEALSVRSAPASELPAERRQDRDTAAAQPRLRLSVGNVQAEELVDMAHAAVAPKDMTTAAQLTETDRGELRLLARLAEAIESDHVARGALVRFRDHVQPLVSLHDTEVAEAGDGTFATAGQASLDVSWLPNPAHEIVSIPMKLAGVVAGRWCADRGLPIPYRVMPQAELNRHLLEPFIRDVINPKMATGDRPSLQEHERFMQLLGRAEISAAPGPYFLTGVDIYTKSTSPLRRYSDLVVHWQIHAALAEEARTGRSLAVAAGGGGARPRPTARSAAVAPPPPPRGLRLPFSLEQLETTTLPMLRHREFAQNSLMRRYGTDEYTLQALFRAWRFGEAPLPETFRLEVMHAAKRAPVWGRLSDMFDLSCFILPTDLSNTPWRTDDLKPGDVLEVRIREIRPYHHAVGVVPIRKIEA